VGVSPEGELLIGQRARNQYRLYPESTVKSVKRLMGKDTIFKLGDKEMTPPEVSALILGELKRVAEEHLGQAVEQAVITVPAYFGDTERRATQEAGELAGLEVVRIINEPTAAALVYGSNRSQGERILVYDLGGGTFDVSIVEVEEGVIEVVSTAGDRSLGGDDFDKRLIDEVLKAFEEQHGANLSQDRKAMARLGVRAEEAKIHLSSHPFAIIQEPNITEVKGRPLNLEREISRPGFEALIADLLDRTLDLVQRALQDAGLKPKDISRTLLVGGSTRIPDVSRRVKSFLGQVPLGSINPDECVALGAALQAGLITGETVDAVLVDVVSHSLGVRCIGRQFNVIHDDVMSVIIPRNTAIPTSRSEVYSTAVDDQPGVNLHIYEGESMIASKNTCLGNLCLDGIPPMPRGVPQILVKFQYDLDGILHVSALERSGERERTMSITRVKEERQPEEVSGKRKRGTARRQAVLKKARRVARELGPDGEHLMGLTREIEHAEVRGDEDEAARLTEDLWHILFDIAQGQSQSGD
jgi:molecular chaperone DnaK